MSNEIDLIGIARSHMQAYDIDSEETNIQHAIMDACTDYLDLAVRRLADAEIDGMSIHCDHQTAMQRMADAGIISKNSVPDYTDDSACAFPLLEVCDFGGFSKYEGSSIDLTTGVIVPGDCHQLQQLSDILHGVDKGSVKQIIWIPTSKLNPSAGEWRVS